MDETVRVRMTSNNTSTGPREVNRVHCHTCLAAYHAEKFGGVIRTFQS